MRITRETLNKIIRDTVEKRTKSDRNILAVYLHGSLLGDNFLLGGTADIDLFFLHMDQAPVEREIVHLTDDVHLDIAHHFHRDYRQTRQLRVHPWLGPTLKDCKVLFDPQHFLDFTLASVRGQYERPDFMLQRSRNQVDTARQIWISLSEEQSESTPSQFLSYLKAVEHAANSVAGLYGSPLTERHLLEQFPQRASAAGRPGLSPGLLGLLGGQQASRETVENWLPVWQTAYESVPAAVTPARLHHHRLNYYLKAFQTFIAEGRYFSSLWPVLRTWTLAVSLNPDNLDVVSDWQSNLAQLDLLGSAFQDRLKALDAYLDMVEEVQDQWAAANGANM